MDLLFKLATWHVLAKLQIHTDKTLDLLAVATKTLTSAMRWFLWVTCEAFTTQDLQQEAAACGRCIAACVAKGNSRAAKGKETTGWKPKKLNLATYKYHALADYVKTIRRFGPMDNYNTQIVHLFAYLAYYHWLLHDLGRAATQTGQEVLCKDKQEQHHIPDCKSPEARRYCPFHHVQGPIQVQPKAKVQVQVQVQALIAGIGKQSTPLHAT